MSEEPYESDEGNIITNKEAWDFFLDGPRDVFTCGFCGSDAHRGNPPDMPGALYAEVDNEPAIVCVECNESYDWETIAAEIRHRRKGTKSSVIGGWFEQVRGALRPVSSRFPAPLSVHDVRPENRASLIPETTVFLGRLMTGLGLIAAVLAAVAIFAGLTGALFVSPTTGVRWFSLTAGVYLQWALFLAARPYIVIGSIGLGYLAHLVEYQRHIGELERELGRSRPRWHYLTFVAGVGLVGWFVWVLSQRDILGQTFLPVGVLTWSAGAFAVVYFLHQTLLEDRWSYGLQIHSSLWKFPAQFAVGLMLYDGVLGLPGPETNAYAVGLVPPVFGLLYAGRRYAAFTERGAELSRWFEQVSYRWRQTIPWPQPPIERRGGSPEINQFGHLDDQPREDRDHEVAGTSSLDQQQELEQTREWAEYLESELHDREKQMQDLEARLAKVRQELKEAREADSTDGPTTDEHDDILTDLFDIRDNFQRALHAESILEDDAAADLSEGIELIDSQIRSILEREGVEEIDTSGEVDPTRHRVVKTVPAVDADPGEIVDVYQLGYRLDDRVIREAHVVVAEEPEAEEEDGPRDNDGQSTR